ncbi:MAG: hypothetical protein LBC20_06825 [Planctomycetaceae bacterium]|nr:hypothetical protein [Planctomycetaceae bacterium]
MDSSHADYYQNGITPLATLSTIHFILPFQGEIVGDDCNPTRWVGLAYIVLSGRGYCFFVCFVL